MYFFLNEWKSKNRKERGEKSLRFLLINQILQMEQNYKENIFQRLLSEHKCDGKIN